MPITLTIKPFFSIIQKTLLFSLIMLYVSTAHSALYDPKLKWYSIETPHFIFHFHNGLEKTANEIANDAEPIHIEVSQYFNWQPEQKTHIVITSQSDFPNGNAAPQPSNRIELIVTPPTEIAGLEDFNNWKGLLLRHEYVHIIHLDKAADFSADARSILGRLWLFFPNTFNPRWITEGLATYIESQLDPGAGRGQSSYFRGLMRNEVIHGLKSLSQINQIQIDWPTGNAYYLYGVYFFNFIRDKYGEEKIKEYVDAYTRFPIPYFINTVTYRVFNKKMPELWDEFAIYLNAEFNTPSTQLSKQDSNNISGTNSSSSKVKNLSNTGYFSGFGKIANNGDIYYLQSDREQSSRLIQLKRTNIGLEKSIVSTFKSFDLSYGHDFDIHPQHGILIPLTEIYANNRDSFDLYSIDPNTHKKNQLTADQHYIHAVWQKNGNKIIALKSFLGNHSLDLLDKSGNYISTLWKSNNAVYIGSLNYSPTDNQLVAAVFREKSGWNLEIFDIAQKTWRKITNTQNIESYPIFSQNGDAVFYSADNNGIYNVFRLSLNTGQTNQLTDTSTIALHPNYDQKLSTLYYSQLGKNGFDFVSQKINADFSQYTLQPNNNLLAVASEAKSTHLISNNSSEILAGIPEYLPKKPYQSIKYLKPTFWFPILTLTEYQSSFGIATYAEDPLRQHLIQAAFAQDIKNVDIDWNVSYLNLQHLTNIQFLTQRQNFYAIDHLRRETITSFGAIRPFTKRNFTWQLLASIQNTKTSFFDTNNNDVLIKTFSSDQWITGVILDTTARNSRTIHTHSGIQISAAFEMNKFSSSLTDYGKFSASTSLLSPPLLHSVFELAIDYVKAGNQGERVYLGGQQVDLGARAFSTSTYSLKGYPVDQFNGTNLQKVTSKAYIPLFKPQRSLMTPPIGISRISLQPFFSAARAGSNGIIDQLGWSKSVGAEIRLGLNAGYGRWPLAVFLGMAKGLDQFGEAHAYTLVNSQF